MVVNIPTKMLPNGEIDQADNLEKNAVVPLSMPWKEAPQFQNKL
jgi:hypothetical protein